VNLSQFVSLQEELHGEREERLENAKDPLTFGIPFLDEAFPGIFKNDLVLVAGRSGQGKSEIALHVALTNAVKGKRVVLLALEHERREVARRMLYKEMAKEFYRAIIRPGGRPNYLHWYAGKQETLLSPYYEKAARTLSAYSNLKVFYRGQDFGLKELRMIFASIKGQADLLVLDHLHYMDFADDNENRAHKEAVKEIRNLALIHGIPVILVAHIRKADRRNPNPLPDMEDIHGSSDIFKIATKAIIIAPAKDQDVQPGTKTFRFPTYFRLAKCRQDGGLQWFCGLSSFDMSKGQYDEHYVIGNFNQKGEWQTATEKPFWAVSAR
jgi:replicative DNA helicase